LTGKQEGEFTTNNYPQEYNKNSECQWVIQVTKGFQIELNFTDFRLEDSFDYVDIYDGPTKSSKSIGRYTGFRDIPIATSSSNSMSVYFYTDGEDQYPGFRAVYKAGKFSFNFPVDKGWFSLVPMGTEYCSVPSTLERFPVCFLSGKKWIELIFYSRDQQK
jgi:CUB domain.